MLDTRDRVIEDLLAHAVVTAAYATALAEQLSNTPVHTETDTERAIALADHALAMAHLTQRIAGSDTPLPFVLKPAALATRLCAD